MKRSKSSEPCDRLSELSDPVILHILSFMSMRDVVRTTILSKRWKDLWTLIPCLTFKGIAESSHRFRSFVNGALIFWRGTRILKFQLHLVIDPYFTRDLDSWLCFAKSKRVEELHIKLSGPLDGNNYSAPQCLYSCSDIRKLSLVGCGLNPKVDGKIHWNNLKSLRIEKVPLSEHVINQVLSCSPGLEVLILCLRESCENLNIQSSSLKMLKILKKRYYDEDKATKLRIWAPNLEQLDILGLRHCRSQLINISSICRASVNILAAETYGYQLFEEMLKQLSQSTRLVEKVTLYFPCVKVLAKMKKKAKDILAPLSTTKFLKISVRNVDEMMDLLEIFPNLTMLVLEHNPNEANQYHHRFEICCHNKEPFVSKFDAEDSLEPKTDILMPYLPHLRTVEVTWAMLDSSIFPFIEFMLKGANKLQKMVFKVKRMRFPPKPLDPSLCLAEYLFLAAQKLLSVQRSFPAAEVIMCHDDSITSMSIC